MRSKYLVYAVLLLLSILAPFVLQNAYLRHLLVMVGIFGMLAVSLDIIMGRMGQFSFGHQAFFGVGAYTSALLYVRLGWSPWLGFLGAIVVSGTLGLFVGYVCLRLRAFYLGIVTMGFGLIVWLAVCNWYLFTGGMMGVRGVLPPTIEIPGLFKIGFDTEVPYYYLVLALLLLEMYLVRTLMRSRFGRALSAVRENEELAKSIGIAPFRYLVATFPLATALAGLAGALYGHYIRLVTPDLLSIYYQFIMIVMVIVGGLGTLGGPVLGAAIFVLVPEWLRMVEELRLVLFGVVLIVCIVFMPRGIYPSVISLGNRLIALGAWLQRKLRT